MAWVRPHNPNFTLKSVVTACGGTISRLMGAGEGDPLEVRLLSHNEKGMVLRVGLGAQLGIAKVFDPENPASTDLFKREASILNHLNQTGLSAGMLGADLGKLLIVCAYIPGSTLDETLKSDAPDGWLGPLGAWFRAFSEKMPTKAPTVGNWHDYLMQYDEPALTAAVAENHDLFATAPITRLRIAKNDAFLANFIVDEAGHLRGIDFEATSLKPIGWDLMLTTRVLAKSYPAQLPTLAKGVVAGWGAEVEGIPADQFAQMCEIFAKHTAGG